MHDEAGQEQEGKLKSETPSQGDKDNSTPPYSLWDWWALDARFSNVSIEPINPNCYIKLFST